VLRLKEFGNVTERIDFHYPEDMLPELMALAHEITLHIYADYHEIVNALQMFSNKESEEPTWTEVLSDVIDDILISDLFIEDARNGLLNLPVKRVW
jgi:hypothetical protein